MLNSRLVKTRRLFYIERKRMDKLLTCAKAFEHLLHIEYRILLGRKGTLTALTIAFASVHFHHLMGLGKLKDLQVASQNRHRVFQDILSGKLSYDAIKISDFWLKSKRCLITIISYLGIMKK